MPIGRQRRRVIGVGLALIAVMVLVIVVVLFGRESGKTSVSSAAAPPSTPAQATTSTVATTPTSATSIEAPARTSTTSPRTSVATTAATTAATNPACPSTLAGQLAATGGGSQLVTVEAQSTGSTSATLTMWQRSGSCWRPAGGPWVADVGYNGLSAHKEEGDGTTPIGLYGISSSFYGNGPNPGVHGSYHVLVCGDWWDENPSSPEYNTFQHVATCGTANVFGGGSEALWTETTAYQSFAVIEYNTNPVIDGAGSAIFIHDNVGGPTDGCVSLAPGNLDTLLRWFQPGESPHIAIDTSSDIGRY